MEIEALRRDIDKLDKQIVELFKRRLLICKSIAKYKKKQNISINDSQREKYVLFKIKANETKEFVPYIEQLYLKIFELSKNYQRTVQQENEEQ